VTGRGVGPGGRRQRARRGWRSRSGPAFLPVVATVAFAFPSALQAQGELTIARARIDVTRAESVRVELDYTFQVDSATAIPFEGLAFRPSELRNVQVGGAGRSGSYDPADFSWGVRADGRLKGALPLGPGSTGAVRVRLSYDVVGAREGEDPYRLRVPILAPAWPSAEALPGIFVAEALAPGEWTLYEAFPSGLTRAADAATLARWTLELPAVPALLSFRATAGTPALGGLVQILDGLVLVILALLAVAAWVHFRRSV